MRTNVKKLIFHAMDYRKYVCHGIKVRTSAVGNNNHVIFVVRFSYEHTCVTSIDAVLSKN